MTIQVSSGTTTWRGGLTRQPWLSMRSPISLGYSGAMVFSLQWLHGKWQTGKREFASRRRLPLYKLLNLRLHAWSSSKSVNWFIVIRLQRILTPVGSLITIWLVLFEVWMLKELVRGNLVTRVLLLVVWLRLVLLRPGQSKRQELRSVIQRCAGLLRPILGYFNC